MKILDSNQNKKWDGRGLSIDKNIIIAYKNANFRQKIVLGKGNYLLKVLGKVRTGNGPIFVKISTDRNVNIFNKQLNFNKNWTEENANFELRQNFGIGYLTIYRADLSYGSIELGRVLLEREEVVNNNKTKKEEVLSDLILEPDKVKIIFRKKIGFLIPYSIYGGAEVYLSTLIDGLDENIFNIHLLYLKSNPIQNMISSGLVIHKDISSLDNLTNYIKNNNFDYLIYYNSISAYNMLTTAVKLAEIRTKVVEIYHSNFRWADSLSTLSERKNTDIIFRVSENLAEDIIGVEQKITLPVPIDLEKFSFNHSNIKLNLPNDKRKIIGIVARLSKEKNINYILDLAKETDNYNFVIFGDGPEESNLKMRINQEKISNVYLMGFKKDLYNYYHNFDALLLCSLMEGTPISILEAMACGVPVFTTPVGNITDIIKDKITGFFLTSNIRKDLEIIDQNINSQNIILNARKYIEEKHDRNIILSKFGSALLNLDDKFIKRNNIRILDGEYV